MIFKTLMFYGVSLEENCCVFIGLSFIHIDVLWSFFSSKLIAVFLMDLSVIHIDVFVEFL
jgi:hypothetical protein